jgi:hypothetical protein
VAVPGLVRVAALAALVVACSPTSSPSNRTNSPGSTGSTGTTGRNVVFHVATDLEGKLPTQAGTVALTRESVAGTGFKAVRQNHAGLRCRWYSGRGVRCRDQALLTAVLRRLNKQPGDVRIAVGYDASAKQSIELQALRISGVSGRQLLDAVLAVLATRTSAAKSPARVQISGREVVMLQPGRPYPSGTRYEYAAADVLYEIRKVDRTTLQGILATLS